MSLLSEILLLSFSLNLGIAFGAGLYETKIVLPLWFSKNDHAVYVVNRKNMSEIDTGRKFWGFVTTVPLTLLTLGNLFLAWNSTQPIHKLWLAAALLVLLERIGTFSFFIPTAIKLQKSGESANETTSRLIYRWIGFNYLRNAITLVAWILTLRVLMLA